MGLEKKRIAVNVALLILSFILSIFIGELLCRFFYSHRKKGHHDLFCEYDPLLGWRHKASTEGYYPIEANRVKESFNSKGIRGPDYSYEKKETAFRILILGDSFAEGYMVEFKDLFSEIIKSKLKGRGIDCEVINLGTAGYSTDQELLLFQSEGEKYKPDLTVLMFYFNDIWYNSQSVYWRGYKPLFKLKDGELFLTNTPLPNFEGKYPKSYFRSVKYWLIIHSKLYILFSDRLNTIGRIYKRITRRLNLIMKPHPRVNSPGDKGRDTALVPDEFRIWERRYNATICDAWKITEAIIIKLRKETALVNSGLLVFYIPDSICIDDGILKTIRSEYDISNEQWDMNRVSLGLENICKKNNINFINPAKAFKARADKLKEKQESLFFPNDIHWNIAGNELVGEILTDYIYSHYLDKRT